MTTGRRMQMAAAGVPPPIPFPSIRTALFVDHFTDVDGTLLVDHVPDMGSGWTSVFGSGDAKIESNKVTMTGYLEGPAAWADDVSTNAVSGYNQIEYVAPTVMYGDPGQNVAGLLCHVTDALNLVSAHGTAGTAWRITEKVAGSDVHLFDGPVAAHGDVVSFEWDGSRIHCILNAVVIDSWTLDPVNTSTGVEGIVTAAIFSAATAWDNYEAGTLS